MSLSYSSLTVIGQVKGEIMSGFEPMPWIMFTVPVVVIVWDRNGVRTPLIVNERIVVQGSENIKIVRSQIKTHSTILAQGQRVPAHAVTDSEERCIRGSVLLAAVCQVQS